MTAPSASVPPSVTAVLDYQMPATRTAQMRRWVHAIFAAMCAPAAVVPFVPFVYDYSPLFVCRYLIFDVGRDSSWERLLIFLLAAPFFGGIIIFLWHVRLLINLRTTRIERIAATLAAALSSLMTLGFVAY